MNKIKYLLLLLVIVSSCTTTNVQRGGRGNGKHGGGRRNQGNNQTSTTQPGTQTAPVVINNSSQPVTGLKASLSGLVCRDFDRIDVSGGADDAMMKITSGVVIQLYWKDIQTKEGGEIVRGNRVDQAIDWVRKFKAKYGIDIPIKIRLYCGAFSPDWLINKGYFTLMDERMPKYWETYYINAFADVQQKLAAIYDNMPEISEVVDGATGLKSAENFIRPFGDNAKKQEIGQVFMQAGYTQQNDHDAIIKSFDAMKVWKHTLVSCCFSSYQYLDSRGNAYETADGTVPFINTFINTLGKQAVIGNNGLRTTAGSHGEDFAEGGERYKLYNYFKKVHDEYGVKVYFQTSTTKRSGSALNPVIEDGIKYGAEYIELPTAPREYRELLGNELESLNQKVKSNKK